MDTFAIFKIAQDGMEHQQQQLTLLATQMATRSSAAGATKSSGFSQYSEAQQASYVTSNENEVVGGPSYLNTVTTMMESMRIYRMNASVASAARSMIENALQIAGK